MAPPTRTPVRVLHVLACDAAAGTELMTARLAGRSAGEGVTAAVAILDAPGPIADRLAADGIEHHALGASDPFRALWRLARLVRRTRPDVLCGYGFRTGLLTRLVARTARPRPRVITGVRGLYVTEIETLDGPRGRAVMAVERATARLVDAYVVNSRGAVEVLADHGIDRARLHLVPNGLDAEHWSVPDRAGRTDGPPTVVCVGRFSAIKRHADVVEAAAILAGRGVEARFVFAGDGPLRAATAARAAALGLGDRVQLLGAIDREALRALLVRADVACLASAQEGMPGSVMEAMASGLPVVGTDVNGIRDLVVDGVTGRLVPPGRPPALADALEPLLRDPALRARLGRAGRERIVRDFSFDGMVAATCAIQRGLVAG